ncbi:MULTISPECIES: CtpF protein [unclassified Rhizobium]|uniref:AAA family ATPase n=1 Tax=unclassified Rhizobium TaxID=2613769 RepID=UPI0016091CE7|nr:MULTISPECIES: CtpF protein [unclassified Rhizobium]MBB3315543.1 pilus assembly protein CpaE [Rhizobium sp. BK181]MBB3542406.1 pilus assembly protein CpaE [Rhizobium sp. BK399]MCS3738271.1 pilus assembly protein CpaE [Rhizobium sp. BK661]MCS4093111.1 pilus assembly protein CpaE [Rhizobium sp. BK176]
MSTVEYEIKNTTELRNAEDAMRMAELETMRPLPRISVHAFCESEELQRVMERCSHDRRMSKVGLRITSGGIAAAANMFASAPTPNLIILETKAGAGNLLTELAPLASVCDPSTKVIIVGYYNDIALYRELVRNGISEYMVQPVAMPDIMMAMATIFVDPDAEPLGRSIAFIGAKGGVGSSTIAHNCAFGISNLFSTETILADLDLPYGTANIDFDQDPTQGIAEAVYAPDRLDEVFLDRLLTKCSEHLSLLAAPSLLDRAYDFEGQAFQPVLEVLQRNAPVTVLDVPHAWSEWTRSVLASVDEVVICASPDLANLRNAKNMMDALRKMRPNDKMPHLILNQVGMPKRPEISPSDFCEPLETDPIAIIPFDANLFGNAANSGRMISEMDAKSPTAETFSQVSHIVTGRIAVRKARKGRLLGLLKRK